MAAASRFPISPIGAAIEGGIVPSAGSNRKGEGFPAVPASNQPSEKVLM